MFAVCTCLMEVLAGALAIATEFHLTEEGMQNMLLRLLPMPLYQLWGIVMLILQFTNLNNFNNKLKLNLCRNQGPVV